MKKLKKNSEPLLRIEVITAHPSMFYSVLNTSILKIAQEKKIVEIYLHNLHDYANDRFKHIDDTPYGGGAGMIIKCEPVFKCVEKLLEERHYDEIIYMTADGNPLNQKIANELSLKKNIIILAGHYKGIDQRIRDKLITKEISIGDYVLSGGELPAMVLIDSVVRLVPGVLGNSESALEDSFQNGLLEPPYYTKPADFRGMKVPEILLSGNHKEINQWREEQAILKTKTRRPDLINENPKEI
ncbi:MAG: tRNA (guanosine(37)-N1)-methyltransferase TrmD [Candidatus Kapabacteria bacterium]|nr:tRNA (guanosine(37)-N1)-methyltransferase TrmD [Candidatus Kapabacteria bacterium]